MGFSNGLGLCTYIYGEKSLGLGWVGLGRGGGLGEAHQPRKRTLVPGGWEGRLLRRRRVEGRGWVEDDMIYLCEGREDERGSLLCLWRLSK